MGCTSSRYVWAVKPAHVVQSNKQAAGSADCWKGNAGSEWKVSELSALLQTMYTISWKRYSPMTVAFFSCGLFSSSATKKRWFPQEWVWGVDLASRFPRSQSNQASVECAAQTSPTQGCPTSQLTRPKGFVAYILVPVTAAHLQGSKWSLCLNLSGLLW